MTKVTSFRVILNGQEKELFYILEKKNEGLTLIPRHGTDYRENTSSLERNPYIESRISIHPSNNDPNGNTIHRTLVSENIARSTHIWTDAIKKKTGFVPVFWKLCSSMFEPTFDPKKSDTVVAVGEYHPVDFVLCYFVLVSAANRRFFISRPVERMTPTTGPVAGVGISYHFGRPFDFYTIDHEFKRFRITLLISFLGAASIPFEHTFHHFTVPLYDPNITPDEAAHTQEFVKGRNEAACLHDLKYARNMLLEKFLDSELPEYRDHARSLYKFFAHPDKKSQAYLLHAMRGAPYYALFNPDFMPEFFRKKSM